MEWTSDTTSEKYTTMLGNCQGMVWQHPQGTWAALVSRDRSATAQNSFPSLEEAQAWCETRLEELAAAGRCDGD